MLSHHEKPYLPKIYSNPTQSLSHHTKCYVTNVPKVCNDKKLAALAEKFHRNWTEHKQSDIRETDDSLTNLNWLNNVTSIMGPQSPSLSPHSLLNPQNMQTLPNIDVIQKSVDNSLTKNTDYMSSHAQSTLTHHLDCALKDGGLLDPLVRYDYKNNWSGKPPFSYATLICMAMRELNKTKITLSDIYGWITDNFIYYRLSDSSWQNSVRHNLSLNKCFEKVPRSKDERGKGGFWRINPKYADRLESNLIKYRRQFPVYSSPKISSGLPAASTLLSRGSNTSDELYHIIGDQNYYQQSLTTDDGWQETNYLQSPNSPVTQLIFTESSWAQKNKGNYLPNLSINNNSNVFSPRAFNSSMREMASQEDYAPMRKHCLKIPQIYRSQNLSKLQSLDEFRTSETGQKVDTQMRADITPNQSPTMYSLLNQINSPPSHISIDDIDSAASSSFDTELTANSGSCATYHSHSDDHEDSLRFNSVIGEDFMVGSEDYLACDSIRNQDNLFSQFI